MNYRQIVLAATAATIVLLTYGFLVYGTLIAQDYNPYPGVYRSAQDSKSHMPLAFAGLFVAMLVATLMYAKGYEGGSGVAEGARFGLLVGIFVACVCVGTNYATLNIGSKLALEQAVATLVEWPLYGIVIGLLYRPDVGKRRP
jgi:hypothetical protein